MWVNNSITVVVLLHVCMPCIVNNYYCCSTRWSGAVPVFAFFHFIIVVVVVFVSFSFSMHHQKIVCKLIFAFNCKSFHSFYPQQMENLYWTRVKWLKMLRFYLLHFLYQFTWAISLKETKAVALTTIINSSEMKYALFGRCKLACSWILWASFIFITWTAIFIEKYMHQFMMNVECRIEYAHLYGCASSIWFFHA